MRALLALFLCALTVSAQQPAPSQEQQQPSQPVVVAQPIHVTAIDIVADVRDASGKLPQGLTPDDFVVIEDGVERKVIGVDYLKNERAAQAAQPAGAAPAATPTKPWQTVLYFDTDLSNGSGRRQTAKELAKHVDRLVQMGTVDVVLANPRPTALLQNSRDAEAVRKALKTVETSTGSNQIAMHRMDFMKHVQSTTQLEAARETDMRYTVDSKGNLVKERPAPQPRSSNLSQAVTSVDARTVRPYVEQEIQLINRHRRNLTTWLSNYNRYAPRTLIMATDGYDLDPLEYYSAHLNKGDDLELRSYVSQAALADSAEKMGKSLAGAGWMTVSVQGNTLTDGWMDDAASATGVGRVHKFIEGNPQAGPRQILYRPADPLRKVAEETGGDVVANSGKIAQAIDRIDDRLRITYQVDRQPDGKARAIQVRARDPKLKVHATRWAASSTPDEMAEQRALAQLQEGGFPGDLAVEAKVDWSAAAATGRKQGSLHVVSKIPGLTAKGDFRFTLAILVPPGQAFVTSKPLSGFRLNGGVFDLRTPLDLPPATSVVVIAIEDMATGMWGSSRIQVP